MERVHGVRRASKVLVEALAEKGVMLTTDEAADRFLGRSLGSLAEVVRSEFGVEIDPAFLAGMRDGLYARFRAELDPLPGVAAAIDSLKAMQVSCCVASSSQRERIELSLSVTGLLSRLAPHIFSATMVEPRPAQGTAPQAPSASPGRLRPRAPARRFWPGL